MTETQKNTKCPVCGNYKNRDVSNDAIIEIDGNILLIKRGKDPYKDFWALPGGHVEFDETVEESVAREVKEETGLDVISLKLFGVYSNPERHPKQTVAVAYLVKTKGEIIAGDDASDFKLFSKDEIPDILAFDHKEILDDYLKKS